MGSSRNTAAALLGAAAVLMVGGCGSEPSSAALPKLGVVDLEGLEAVIDSQRGQGLVVNFWATWCPPCVAELPELVEAAEAARGDGVRVLLVSYDLMVPGMDAASATAVVRAFLESNGWDVPNVIFDELDYDGVNARYGLPGPIPITLAFDADGHEVDRQLGLAGRARFDGLFEAAAR